MSKLYFLNRFILQWFFIRLTRNEKKIIEKFRLDECSQMTDGSYSLGFSHKPEDVKIQRWFSIQYWVIPGTGWGTDFRYLGGQAKHLDLNKSR